MTKCMKKSITQELSTNAFFSVIAAAIVLATSLPITLFHNQTLPFSRLFCVGHFADEAFHQGLLHLTKNVIHIGRGEREHHFLKQVMKEVWREVNFGVDVGSGDYVWAGLFCKFKKVTKCDCIRICEFLRSVNWLSDGDTCSGINDYGASTVGWTDIHWPAFFVDLVGGTLKRSNFCWQ